MGRRGPPPTPTEVLRQRGSWLVKYREGEPKAPKGKPSIPKSLKGEPRALFQKMMKLIESMGILSPTDGGQLERYCEYFIRWRKVEDAIAKLGDNLLAVVVKDDSARAFHKLTRQSHLLDLAMKQIEKEYGLTPSSRARFVVDNREKAEDPDDELFKPRIVG